MNSLQTQTVDKILNIVRGDSSFDTELYDFNQRIRARFRKAFLTATTTTASMSITKNETIGKSKLNLSHQLHEIKISHLQVTINVVNC